MIKRLLGACLSATYVLPFLMGLVTYGAHDLYHLRERLGWVAAPDGDAGGHAFVHEHGGRVHSHDTATDALLGANQHEESSSQKHAVATMEPTGHLPARSEVRVFVSALLSPRADEPALGVAHFPPAPPPPPPRA
jgi:hypothetical protein